MNHDGEGRLEEVCVLLASNAIDDVNGVEDYEDEDAPWGSAEWLARTQPCSPLSAACLQGSGPTERTAILGLLIAAKANPELELPNSWSMTKECETSSALKRQLAGRTQQLDAFELLIAHAQRFWYTVAKHRQLRRLKLATAEQ